MRASRRMGALMAAGAAAAAVTAPIATAGGHRADGRGRDHAPVQHVLLLSVDGLHQSDLELYVRRHPAAALAALTRAGVEFTHAQAPFPSDSFPGIIAQVTGGDPRTTGIYYDDSYNRDLLPPGTTSCSGATPGTEVPYFEQADRDPRALDAGQGLPDLPDRILAMTPNPTTLLDPAQLPVDPATCAPVSPHGYLKVNTVFEVARAAGLRTAWADKHPAYELLNGPSGTGVQDLFTPEINSDAPTAGAANDWTTDNALTQQYDGYKVKAVLHEIDGLDHSGTETVGTPAIFGMNFQAVSTAQKLPRSNGLTGGYQTDGTPGPLLARALDFIDAQVGAMLAEIRARHLEGSTDIILSAKHGQSPTDPRLLTRIPDGAIVDALNAAWRAEHPSATKPLVAFTIDDDGFLAWLNDRSAAATEFAQRFLLGHDGIGNDINGNPKPYTASGLRQVLAGADAARLIGVPADDARVPDLIGLAQVGSVYTSKQGKIAEHGGDNPQDRSVPLVVAGAGIDGHEIDDDPVETTGIAPTILSRLGLDPRALQAVQAQGTRPLEVR